MSSKYTYWIRPCENCNFCIRILCKFGKSVPYGYKEKKFGFRVARIIVINFVTEHHVISPTIQLKYKETIINELETMYGFDRRLEQTCLGRFILRVVTPFFRVSMSKSFWEAILTSRFFFIWLELLPYKNNFHTFMVSDSSDGVSGTCQSWICSKSITILSKFTMFCFNKKYN